MTLMSRDGAGVAGGSEGLELKISEFRGSSDQEAKKKKGS
jgi:hypothetical protein